MGPMAAFTGSLTLAAVLVSVGGSRHHALGLAGFALVAGAAAAVAPLATAPVIAAITWMFNDGFLVGSNGTLAWHGAQDGWRLAILASSALAGGLIGACVRAHDRRVGPIIRAYPRSEPCPVVVSAQETPSPLPDRGHPGPTVAPPAVPLSINGSSFTCLARCEGSETDVWLVTLTVRGGAAAGR